MKTDFSFLKKFEILLVEDSEMVVDSLSYVFEKYFKKLYVGKSGREGIELFENINPDIILADIDMPRMDGLEMIAKIREQNKLIPIVVNSAITDTEIVKSAKNLGICEYVLKPTDVKYLLNVLQSGIKKRYDA